MPLADQKQRILDKCDMAHALTALNLSITSRELAIFAGTRALLDHGSRSRLEHAEFVLDVNIQNGEKHAGYKGGDQFLLDMGRAYRLRKPEIVQFPKFFIDKFLFHNYERVFSTWRKIQPHALIRIDFEGKDRDLYIPEASLYEDMCFAFNLGWKSKCAETKAQVKAHIFYKRASLISAYNFVECYLNGLAFDFLATAQRTLSQADRDFLSEWDTTKDRTKYVKFRDKALQYPKMILKRKTPVLQESSEPLSTLLSRVNYRDAVVHNTPKLNLAGDEMPKIRDLIELRFDEVTKIVDAAVEFVRIIDKSVNQGRYDVSWLLPRGRGGTFPAESFA